MSEPSDRIELIATATFGLESVVARELQDLGYESQSVETGRVIYSADLAAICRSNLWLRVADRVLLRVGHFPADDFDALFEQTKSLPWEAWIPQDAVFPVKGRSVKSQLTSVPAVQRTVKKAIVERLQHAYQTTDLPETGVTVPIEIGLLRNQATLTLDTSGVGLHKRGYRTLSGQAPLKETLAAAMVLLSYWREDRPFLYPFCGTGTIPIEAAMIGRNLAPGINREFVSEMWPIIPKDAWRDAFQEVNDLALRDLPERIIGSDCDDQALSLARYHAKQAGVENDIHFQRRDFSEISSKRDYGCLITNPPYGKRLSEQGDVEDLYRSMPDVLRRFKTWNHYIFTAHPQLEQLVGREADRRRKLYNGRIECTYFQFHGPRPPKKQTGKDQSSDQPEAKPVKQQQKPAFGGLPDDADRHAEEFRNRLLKRARHLRKWPAKRGITCFRLYERDIPEIPLIIDRYEDCLHISEYERPNDHTAAEHLDWLDMLANTAAKTLEIDRANVFTKFRGRQRGKSQHERIAEESEIRVVNEGGLKFEVNLSDYTDTGLFLDHRQTRSMVRDLARDKHVLNLFGYTGSFTVYAADGGAKDSLTVDLSYNYLEWAERNLRLNGFSTTKHKLKRADVMKFMNEHEPAHPYDIIVLDPPTFSNSKSTDNVWDVQRQHVELLNLAIERLAPDGVIFFSTNFRRFKLAEDELVNASVREISKQTVPEDFRNQRIHRCWRITKQDSQPT